MDRWTTCLGTALNLAVLALVLTACSDPVRPECSTDNGCGDGRICQDSKCVVPQAGPCPTGKIRDLKQDCITACNDKRVEQCAARGLGCDPALVPDLSPTGVDTTDYCVDLCAGKSCNRGFECNPSLGYCLPQCASDTQTASGEVCSEEHRCRYGACVDLCADVLDHCGPNFDCAPAPGGCRPHDPCPALACARNENCSLQYPSCYEGEPRGSVGSAKQGHGCDTDDDCGSDLFCYRSSPDNLTPLHGVCTKLPDVGAQCAHDVDCGAGLFCFHLSSTVGYCTQYCDGEFQGVDGSSSAVFTTEDTSCPQGSLCSLAYFENTRAIFQCIDACEEQDECGKHFECYDVGNARKGCWPYVPKTGMYPQLWSTCDQGGEQLCENDEDCIGGGICEDEVCVCSEVGGRCGSDNDCEAGGLCLVEQLDPPFGGEIDIRTRKDGMCLGNVYCDGQRPCADGDPCSRVSFERHIVLGNICYGACLPGCVPSTVDACGREGYGCADPTDALSFCNSAYASAGASSDGQCGACETTADCPRVQIAGYGVQLICDQNRKMCSQPCRLPNSIQELGNCACDEQGICRERCDQDTDCCDLYSSGACDQGTVRVCSNPWNRCEISDYANDRYGSAGFCELPARQYYTAVTANPSTETCHRYCTEDAHCGTGGFTCDTADTLPGPGAGHCYVACVDDSQCGPGNGCDLDRAMCVPNCNVANPCGAGQHCEAGLCKAGCVADGDCFDTARCCSNSGKCVMNLETECPAQSD